MGHQVFILAATSIVKRGTAGQPAVSCRVKSLAQSPYGGLNSYNNLMNPTPNTRYSHRRGVGLEVVEG